MKLRDFLKADMADLNDWAAEYRDTHLSADNEDRTYADWNDLRNGDDVPLREAPTSTPGGSMLPGDE